MTTNRKWHTVYHRSRDSERSNSWP